VTIFRRFDAWAGLRLFHPPIIRFCQWTGYTQWRLHRDMWFAAALWITWDSWRDGDPWWWVAILLALCIVMGARAAFVPAGEPETGRALWMRMLLWGILALSLPIVVAEGRPFELLDNLWLLTAEYAATITDIPPREKRRARRLRERAA
jgi:hypothetical protein